MKCPDCGSKLSKRPIKALRDWPIFSCKKCRKSFAPSNQEASQPISEEARISVQKANRLDARLISNDVKLKILIWGPGKGSKNNALANKRQELKDVLCSKGHEVNFSEDLEKLFDAPGRNLVENELKQIEWANLIIVLLGSGTYGATGEIHIFAVNIGNNSWIWLPEDMKGSFASKGVLDQLNLQGANIENYRIEDIDTCLLKTATQVWVDKIVELQNFYKNRRDYYDNQIYN